MERKINSGKRHIRTMPRMFLYCVFTCFILTLSSTLGSFASIKEVNGITQQRRIQGIVMDDKRESLPGVTILIKGSNTGVTTDENGRYEINIPAESTLIFSFMGFQPQEISTVGKERIDVTLISNDIQLEEVVVTGYNTVERKHLASSITSMDVESAKTRPIFKLGEAFSGTLPGVTLLMGNNLPGATPGNITIRGISTLKDANPLVIVDGIEQSIHDIDPNQVKSISVLKDAASASMYGSRGANGVIIIETERGYTGSFKVDINSWFAVNDPIDLPDHIYDAATYMRLNNETRAHQNQSLLYTEDDIKKAESGEIPSVNWLDQIMERRAFAHNNTASISGGGGVGTFNLMLGHIQEYGLNEIEGTQKFSARFNTNINIADKFVLLADFYAHRLQVDRLLANDNGHGLYQVAWRMNPTQQVFYDTDLDIEEHYVLHNNLNPLASIKRGGTKNYLHDHSTINLRPRYYITPDLNIEGNVSYLLTKSANKSVRRTFKFFDENGKPVTTWNNDVKAEQGVSASQITARALANYTKDIRQAKDKIYVTAGAEIMNHTYTDYKEISKASFFGKVNYSFDNRYLLEVTARNDGSSKFAPGHRWGFFPAGALAWNIENEAFMRKLKESKTVNALKLRASYGLIGNENVDPYLWQEIVNNWGWTIRVPNPSFTWEKQRQWNIGLDATLLNNRLNFSAEIYDKFSFDLIYDSFTVPPLTGSNNLIAAANIGEVQNKGWEISASWSDKIGDFSYKIGGMLFDNTNKVIKAGYNPNDTLVFKDTSDKIWYNGIAIDNYYGFETDGYFQTQQEIDATTAKMPNTLPGDIKYVDQNGDGIINDQDRVNLGDPFPHMNYSINLDLKYKNWDFSALGTGVGKRTARLGGMEGYPVYVDGGTNSLGTPRQYYVDNRWTPENPNSRFPRIWSGTSSNTYLSDVWLSNAAFFRIKMLQVGYTIPEIGKHFKNTRIYLNIQDAFTFTKWEGLEPERNGGDGSYPRMATFSLGIRTTIL